MSGVGRFRLKGADDYCLDPGIFDRARRRWSTQETRRIAIKLAQRRISVDLFSHARSGGELTRPPTHGALTSNEECNCNARNRRMWRQTRAASPPENVAAHLRSRLPGAVADDGREGLVDMSNWHHGVGDAVGFAIEARARRPSLPPLSPYSSAGLPPSLAASATPFASVSKVSSERCRAPKPSRRRHLAPRSHPSIHAKPKSLLRLTALNA